MAISTAISVAVSGLQIGQKETDLVAQNIARAGEPSYVKKQLVRSDYVGMRGTIGMQGRVQRQVDLEVQRQLVQTTPSTTYSEVQARFAKRLDEMMGTPASSNSLASMISNFNKAIQELATSPESLTARISAVNGVQALASRLNQMTQDVQGLRTDAEQGIADSVRRVNELTANIARLNEKIVAQKTSGQDITQLEDARDISVKELATLMDVQTREQPNGQMTVFTRAGLTLVDAEATQLKFDQVGTLSANALWDQDPTRRGVGTITVTGAGGQEVDAIASGLIRSGKIAAYVQARDEMLVKAQNQLDALAASLADAMSGKTVQGTAATASPQAGFDVDLTALRSGNPVTLTYRDNATGRTHVVSLVRVDDPATLPLQNSDTPRDDDTVFGIDFSGGMASVVTQIQAALGSRFAVSNPSGSTLRILDDGAANSVDVTGLSAHVNLSAVVDGEKGFPLFMDGAREFTDSLDGFPQRQGFAGRITVNPEIVKNPARLVQWQTSPATGVGDPARPKEIVDRLKSTTFAFGSATGVVAGETSFTATIDGFSNAVVSFWGMMAEDTAEAVDSQKTIQNNLEARFNESSSVNIDEELARLIQLQSSYTANARVMQVAKEMLDALLRV